MAKLYTEKKFVISKMQPKRETINFILNYSKALYLKKIGDKNFEIIAN